MKILAFGWAALFGGAVGAAEFTPATQARIEAFAASELLSSRAIVKPKLTVRADALSLVAEAFAEADAHKTLPYRNDKKYRAYFQEFYAEWTRDSWVLRLGQQALRWSESWSLPSLDYWTARRFDRLFLDPVDDQLQHSTGALVRYTSTALDIDAFSALRLAESDYPRLYAQTREKWSFKQGGLRAKIRAGGFDLAPTYAYLRDEHHWGTSLTYAFETFVPKVEFGLGQTHQNFYTLGSDIFLGDLSFFPQLTFFRQAAKNYERILYLPIRYSQEASTLSLENYLTEKGRDLYLSVVYSYEFSDHYQISTLFQNYDSQNPLSLLAHYRKMTAGWLTGLRFESDF